MAHVFDEEPGPPAGPEIRNKFEYQMTQTEEKEQVGSFFVFPFVSFVLFVVSRRPGFPSPVQGQREQLSGMTFLRGHDSHRKAGNSGHPAGYGATAIRGRISPLRPAGRASGRDDKRKGGGAAVKMTRGAARASGRDDKKKSAGLRA
jgi:hypothetical protein